MVLRNVREIWKAGFNNLIDAVNANFALETKTISPETLQALGYKIVENSKARVLIDELYD